MTSTPNDEHVSEVRDHWWWRPGWRLGRQFYAYHVTFEASPALHKLAAQYQDRIRHLAILDLIPSQWLHLTMCGVGFVDQVAPVEIASVNSAVQRVLAQTRPIVTTFSNAVVQSEAVYLPAEPSEPLIALHSNVTTAIRETLGDARLHQLPEQAAGYQPHVSVAYVNSDSTARPIYDALGATAPGSAEVTIAELPLLEFNRDNKMYQWTTRTPFALRGDRS